MARRCDLPKPTNLPIYAHIKSLSKAILARVVSNNKALLKRKGMTFTEQSRQFRDKGLYLNKQTLWSMAHRDGHRDAKLSFVCMIADFWGKPVWEFISVDYSRESDLTAAAPSALDVNKEGDEFL